MYPLMRRLLDSGKTVLVETGGHRSIEHVPDGVVRIMDVNCPGSGESDKMDWQNLERLTQADQVKFVIKDRADYEFARGLVCREASLSRSCCRVVLARARCARSALSGRMDSGGSSRHALQLQALQMKFWSADARGV